MVGPEVCAAVRTEPAVASGGGPTLCGRVRGPGSGPAIIQSDLVIHDEVHLLPAPVFRATARIQARRRLGLTATMIREDGAEPLVFSLIGPKRYDAAWRELEAGGWIARAECMELRVPLG